MFAYANNNPVMFIDPDGRSAVSPLGWILIGFVGVFAISAAIAAIWRMVTGGENTFWWHWGWSALGTVLAIVVVPALVIHVAFTIFAVDLLYTTILLPIFNLIGIVNHLGELSVWRDIQTHQVGRWGPNATDIPRQIYIRNVGTNNLNLVDAMTFAVNAWNDALGIPGHMYIVTFTGNSPPTGASIWFVGGTVNQLLSVRSTLLPGFTDGFIRGDHRRDPTTNAPRPHAGAVSLDNNWRGEGLWIYVRSDGSPAPRRGRRLRAGVHGFIRARDQGSLTNNQLRNLYRNIAVHELAHALGWWGHSNNTLDIMYRNNLDNTWPDARQNLTREEINHLRQVYGLALR